MSGPRALRDPALDARLWRVRETVKVSDIVGRHVTLAKEGAELVGLCPFHNERTPSFNVVNRKGFYHCFGCGAHGDALSFVMRLHGMDFIAALEALENDVGLESIDPARREALLAESRAKAEQRARREVVDRERRERDALSIWAQTRALERGGIVDRYLRGRGVPPPAAWLAGMDMGVNAGWPVDLRHHPALKHPASEARFDAMVAVFRDASGAPRTIHRTFLVEHSDGRVTKADLGKDAKGKPIKVKLTLGTSAESDEAGDTQRFAILLGPPAPAMVECEGIETTLCAMHLFKRGGFTPGSSGYLEDCRPPSVVDDLLIGADKDPVRQGELAAHKAARRWGMGRHLAVRVPVGDDDKLDYADLYRRHYGDFWLRELAS